MNIRIASIKASQTWALRQRVMWPHKPLEYVKVAEDEEGLHFGLHGGGGVEPLSVVSLFVVDREAQFRKFCTDKVYQGNGYGSLLLKYMMKEIENHHEQVNRIWCNARKDKTAFYNKFGLIKTNQEFERGGIDYVIMELIKNEALH